MRKPARQSAVKMKAPCQIQKDERFWVAACMMHFFFLKGDERHERVHPTTPALLWKQPLGTRRIPLVRHGDNVSVVTFTSTLRSTSLLAQLSGDSLPKHVDRRHIIPYVRNSARGPDGVIRKDLEGPTQSTLLLNVSNGFSILFEDKVLSDISYQISFDTMRDQMPQYRRDA